MTKRSPRIDRTCVVCRRTFQGTARANYCPGCSRLNAQTKRRKYRVDERVKQLLTDRYDSRVKGRAAEIAAELGWPTWAVKKVAKTLGLSRPWPSDRRDWTPEEIEYLNQWQGLRSAKWIAKRLGRGETSVILKMHRLGLDRRVWNGYAVRDVARCFGVGHHVVDRWLAKGWLVGQRQGTGRPNEIIRVEESAILQFVREHREEFRLDKADQAWFLHLVFDGPRSAEQLVAAGGPWERANGRGRTSQQRAQDEADRKAAAPAEVARRAATAARLRALHLAPLRTEGNGGNGEARRS